MGAAFENENLKDVLIVGAGLSGIGIAVHLLRACPDLAVELVEMRDAIGGTWDLFRYPGLRSDSDMFTLGYDFRPWKGAKAIADGRDILRYIRETADAFDVTGRIRFGERVVSADWRSDAACWSVETECMHTGSRSLRRCRFLVMCAGYYSYRSGYRPRFAGEECFVGTIVHPQDWPADLDHTGKRVAIIGSGATAITLLPALAESAAHVTMVQRSPTYVASVPARDAWANAARAVLPEKAAYAIARWSNIASSALTYAVSRIFPATVKRMLLAGVRRELGDAADIARDWTPRYAPWDERLCAAPDGDLFKAIRAGAADVVTGEIERLVSGGIRMADGLEVSADIIVTATGLDMVFLGEARVSVDGVAVQGGDKLIYKGCMFDGVPNLAYAFGYTNASWTLKVDLTGRWLGRLFRTMQRKGAAVVVPLRPRDVQVREATRLKSDYIRRAADKLPKQGAMRPWRLHDNYLLDRIDLAMGKIDDGVLRFASAAGGDRA